MPAARFYSSTSGAMDLSGSITSADTSITVSSTTGLPGTTPFTLVLDPGTATEEIVDVTNVSGTTLTITRGVDGSAAQAHSAGVGNVRHMATARDFREPQEHIGASTNVHGVGASAVVGVDTAQTLKNKTLTAPTLTGATTAAETTFQPSSSGVTPIKVLGQLGQTVNLQEWRNSVGAVAKVDKNGFFTGLATNLVIQGDAADTPAVDVPAEGAAGRTVAQVRVDTRADDTADILQLKKNGTAVASFDKDGNLTSPTITSLQSADTSLGSRVTTIEGNLGSQTTFAATSAAKDGKRLHWGRVSVTPNGTGYATVTHGAGFTPTSVQVTAEQAYFCGADPANFTGTTFIVRLLNTAGASPGVATEISYACFE